MYWLYGFEQITLFLYEIASSPVGWVYPYEHLPYKVKCQSIGKVLSEVSGK